jgi:hypothetical protein
MGVGQIRRGNGWSFTARTSHCALQSDQLAERARALVGSNSPSYLDTLAPAYAEAGRFDDARKKARKAVESAEQAGEREKAARLQARLKLCQSGQPYREPN